MPSSPVGSYAKDYADIPAVGIAPPAVRPMTAVNAPDSEPIAVTARGPAWSGSKKPGASNKMAPVCAQVRRFS